MLHARYARVEFADWRHQVRHDLHRHGLARTTRTLAAIAPDGSYFPDFLTPPEGLLGVAEGIEAVVAAPAKRVRRELTILHERTPTPSWTWDLVDRPARDDLGRMLTNYHRRAIAPYWPTMCDRAAVDRATRTRALRTGGVPALRHTVHLGLAVGRAAVLSSLLRTAPTSSSPSTTPPCWPRSAVTPPL